jgi:hypothetical protein
VWVIFKLNFAFRSLSSCTLQVFCITTKFSKAVKGLLSVALLVLENKAVMLLGWAKRVRCTKVFGAILKL